MESNTDIYLKNIIVSIKKKNKSSLYNIRHWENIMIASDNDYFWLKNFTEKQLSSIDLKRINSIKIYEIKYFLLFLKNSSLPEKKMPFGILWNSLHKALSIELPNINKTTPHVAQLVEPTLIKANQEHTTVALLIDSTILKQQINKTLNSQFKDLTWTIINDKALIIGSPILSLPGDSYYRIENHIIPNGFEFENLALLEVLDKKLNPNFNQIVLWNKKSEYTLIPKNAFNQFSRSSVKLSITP